MVSELAVDHEFGQGNGSQVTRRCRGRVPIISVHRLLDQSVPRWLLVRRGWRGHEEHVRRAGSVCASGISNHSSCAFRQAAFAFVLLHGFFRTRRRSCRPGQNAGAHERPTCCFFFTAEQIRHPWRRTGRGPVLPCRGSSSVAGNSNTSALPGSCRWQKAFTCRRPSLRSGPSLNTTWG